MRFGKLRLDQCRYGSMLHMGPFIGKCFELYGEYSEAEVDALRVFLREGNTVVDVGANIGDLTLPMSQMVGSSGRVFAFESHSETYQVLNANMALNAVKNVKAINAFVAHSPDIDMAGPWGEFGFVSEKWRASVMSIDSLGLDQCALIKVDVDGAEYEVLRSAEATIKAHAPVLYFENDDREKSPQLLGYAMSLGYSLYFHLAPMFQENNFYGNPVNHWAPRTMCSQMILGLPPALDASLGLELPKITDPAQWWSFAAP